MRKYLATLHEKPEHHKKRFALLTSGVVTLFIFGVWSLVNFGLSEGGILARDTEENQTGRVAEVSPLGSLRMSLAATFSAFRGTVEEMKDSLTGVDLERDGDFRDGAIDSYGR